MAYQNVSTPRFYINESLYSQAQGNYINSVLEFSPSNIKTFSGETITLIFNYSPTYIMLLGNSAGLTLSSDEGISLGSTVSVNQDIIFAGFSLLDYPSSATEIGLTITGDLGSLSMGRYYEMPVAPESLSLEHDYSGIKKTTSMSGASFSNANWIKPPKWGDREAWQLGDFPRPYSGRRIWDLSFSYISDTDLEPRNYTGTGTFENNLWEYGDDNWFENVLHYTIGGQLPFIFQPDKDIIYTATDTDITPDGIPDIINTIPEFAICRFDMGTFERDQVAPGVYNIKIKVKETW